MRQIIIIFLTILFLQPIIGSAAVAESGDRLYELCPPDGKSPANICSKYVDAHFPENFDSLNKLLDAVDSRKDEVRGWAQKDKHWLNGSQWTLILLGAAATLLISIGSVTYKAKETDGKDTTIDYRFWAIVPTVLTTVVSGVASFYDFGQSHSDNIEAQARYAELLDGIESDMIAAVEQGDTTRIDQSVIVQYQTALTAAVEARTSDFLKLMNVRSQAVLTAHHLERVDFGQFPQRAQMDKFEPKNADDLMMEPKVDDES